MTLIVTTGDLDPATLSVVNGKVAVTDTTKAPNIVAGLTLSDNAQISNGDSVLVALGKLQSQVLLGVGSGSGSDPTNAYESYMNADGAPINPGAPVYLSGPGLARSASGTSLGRKVVALYSGQSALAPGIVGLFITRGSLVLTETQWETITGTNGGLLPGSRYFLDLLNPGMLDAAVNTTGAPGGSFLVPVGYALTQTEFLIDVQPAIRLA